MTRAEFRLSVADALNAVDGISGFASRPAVMLEGNAWPQWRGSAYGGGRHYIDTWNVLVVMPGQDDVTADGYADEHAEAITAALRPLLFIDSIAPAEITTEAGTMLALLFTGRSE
jgi:hypothetical protein